MGAVLEDAEQRPLVWAEHSEILRLVLAGGARAQSRRHNAIWIVPAAKLRAG